MREGDSAVSPKEEQTSCLCDKADCRTLGKRRQNTEHGVDFSVPDARDMVAEL